jgi:hypothetical protein
MPWDNKLVQNLQNQNQSVIVCGKWVVASVDKATKEVSISKKPHLHDTQVDADREATRLAKITPQKAFFSMYVGSMFSNEVVPQPATQIVRKASI